MAKRGTPWAAAETRKLKQLYDQGLTLGKTAKAMNRPTSTIANRAQMAGLAWRRPETAEMLQTHTERVRALRKELELGLLDDAKRLRSQLFAPTTLYNFGGRDNTYAEHDAEQPPHADQQKLVQAVQALTQSSIKISEFAALESGDAAQSLMRQLGRHIGLGVHEAAAEVANDEVPTDQPTL